MQANLPDAREDVTIDLIVFGAEVIQVQFNANFLVLPTLNNFNVGRVTLRALIEHALEKR